MALNKPRLPILNPSHPLAQGLVGAWVMYEGVGTVARDVSGYNNHGTSTNSVAWRSGGALGPATDYTAGTTTYLNCGNASALNPTSALSLFAYIYPTTTSIENWVIARDDATLGRSFAFGFKPQVHLQINGANWLSGGTYTVSTNAWQTIAAVGSAGLGYRTYYNGKQNETTPSWTAPNTTTGPTSIGARTYAAFERGITGYIACAYIYNRVLAESEVRALHIDPYQAFRDAPLWVPTFTAGGGSPPTAPSDLTATATGTTTIDLAWTDNSGDETGFKIERGTDGVVFAQIDTAAADATTYNDTGLTANTLYYYRVRAYNGSGDSSYSNTASATTDSDFMPRHGAVMLSSGVAIV